MYKKTKFYFISHYPAIQNAWICQTGHLTKRCCPYDYILRMMKFGLYMLSMILKMTSSRSRGQMCVFILFFNISLTNSTSHPTSPLKNVDENAAEKAENDHFLRICTIRSCVVTIATVSTYIIFRVWVFCAVETLQNNTTCFPLPIILVQSQKLKDVSSMHRNYH